MRVEALLSPNWYGTFPQRPGLVATSGGHGGHGVRGLRNANRLRNLASLPAMTVHAMTAMRSWMLKDVEGRENQCRIRPNPNVLTFLLSFHVLSDHMDPYGRFPGNFRMDFSNPVKIRCGKTWSWRTSQKAGIGPIRMFFLIWSFSCGMSGNPLKSRNYIRNITDKSYTATNVMMIYLIYPIDFSCFW